MEKHGTFGFRRGWKELSVNTVCHMYGAALFFSRRDVPFRCRSEKRWGGGGGGGGGGRGGSHMKRSGMLVGNFCLDPFRKA